MSQGLLPALIVAAVLVASFLVLPAGANVNLAAEACSYGVHGAPTVTGVAPTSGPQAGGTTVTITGCAFTGATRVKFGDPAATSFIVVNDSTVEAVSPAHAPGMVDVTVTTAKGTSTASPGDKFTFRSPS